MPAAYMIFYISRLVPVDSPSRQIMICGQAYAKLPACLGTVMFIFSSNFSRTVIHSPVFESQAKNMLISSTIISARRIASKKHWRQLVLALNPHCYLKYGRLSLAPF